MRRCPVPFRWTAPVGPTRGTGVNGACRTWSHAHRTLKHEGSETLGVKVKVGPVSANFKGHVTLENIVAPKSYTIVGEGKGGIAGFAKGGADVKLEEEGDITILNYEVTAQVGGKLAQMGSRLIDSTSKKLASQFFANLNEVITGEKGEQETA